MGACSSCLGASRREPHEPESSRLLDDDLYQSSFGYGALNQAHLATRPDPEYLKRERDALESICQRTSDSVIDIWSLHPQPHLQPRATLQTSISSSGSHTAAGSGTHDETHLPTAATVSTPNHQHQHQHQNQQPPRSADSGAVPKHWGEVVINPRKKRSRPALNASESNGRDVFGVLKVT